MAQRKLADLRVNVAKLATDAEIRNWRQRDPALNAALAVFEANKEKADAQPYLGVMFP